MSNRKNCSFPKEEKLKSDKRIAALFNDQSFVAKAFPMRIHFRSVDHPINSSTIQMACSVSKKKFKRAVDRNKIKRRIREAYRLNKSNYLEKLEESGINLEMIIIYVSDTILESNQMQKAMKKGFAKILSQIL